MKEKKIKKPFKFIIALVILGAVLIGILILMAQNGGVMRMPLPFFEQKYEYGTTAQTAIASDKTFASSLCVGENNVPNENISLSGDEKGGLFSLEEKKVLFAKGMHEKIYPASITKLMTAIVACKYADMNATVTIGWQDLELESGSQVCGFKIGDQVSMSGLMNGLLVHSGNDAAMAIARAVGGSADKFVEMMNEEAVAIGATNTHFVSPSGLHDEDHYTTVYDIYLMLNEAMKYDLITNIMQISVYDLQYTASDGTEQHITLDSTDHYLTGEVVPPKGVTVLGGKTGTTSQAGNCLALLSQNSFGQPFISVITGASDKTVLYSDMNMLLAQIES